MAQFAPTPMPHDAHRPEVVAPVSVASPAALGLGISAFATAILGCFFTGFIIPYEGIGVRVPVGLALLISGIIIVLAGMWEFRKSYMMTATTFTAYGGFLAFLGLFFIMGVNNGAVSGTSVFHLVGLFFLCWAIFTAVLWLGSLRTNVSLAVTLGVLLGAYVLLTIGSLAGNNDVLMRIGGWLAIAAAVIAWIASIASIMSTATPTSAFRIPFGRRMAVVE